MAKTTDGCRVVGEAAGAVVITVAATQGTSAGEADAQVEILSRQPSIVTSVAVQGGADGVLVDGNLAYVRQQTSEGALAIFDITDPDDPVAIGDLGAAGETLTPLDFGFAADRAYLGASSVLYSMSTTPPTPGWPRPSTCSHAS